MTTALAEGMCMDLRDAMSFHQMLLGANGASAYTQRQYLFYENLFVEFLQSKRYPLTIDELRPERVSEFLIWYRNRPHPRATRGGEVAVRAAADILKRLGGVLEDNEYVEVNPLRKLRRPKITKFTRVPFSTQEVQAMWGACFRTLHPARDEAIFLLLLDTGMRIGELCSMRLEHLDLDQRQVTVLGKGRRERTIPFGDGQKRDGGRVVRAMRRYLQVRPTGFGADEAYVFLARDRRRLTAAGGNDIIKRVAAAASVDDAYPHRLRHTMATWYLTTYAGDELGLRRIIGHISTNVLADYVHFSQATIRDRAGRASLAEVWLGSATTPVLPAASPPAPKERRLPPPRRAEPRGADQRVDDILAQLSADPELRQALLKALGRRSRDDDDEVA